MQIAAQEDKKSDQQKKHEVIFRLYDKWLSPKIVTLIETRLTGGRQTLISLITVHLIVMSRLDGIPGCWDPLSESGHVPGPSDILCDPQRANHSK